MAEPAPLPIKIKLADIDRSDRLRPVDPDRALLISASLNESGLDTPIKVRPASKKSKAPYVLVIGGHRCAAAELLGWEEIDAIVVDVTADQARMQEVDENLYRAELTALDRAVFLAEKKRLYEKLHPETKHGGDRVSEQVPIFGNLVPRFSDEVAERLGYGQSTIYRILQRANLPADIRARIAGTPLADNGSELDALLKLEPSQRHRALDLITQGKAARVAVAAKQLSGVRDATPLPEADVQLGTLKRAWKAAGASAREQFIEFLRLQGSLESQTGDDT
ncbi:MAG TPA: ParB N-terminal domain-containing protein [Kaistia sp.]|nr:ParB N-terminal domain-containing protein [Kaistia sp.]